MAFAATVLFAIALSPRGSGTARAQMPVPSAAPDYVAAVGPVHGAWTVGGVPATLGLRIAAGSSIAQAHAGDAGSIAIYAFDGHLMQRTCPGDPACAGAFGLDPLGDTATIKSVMQDGTEALHRYHFIATGAPSPGASGAHPSDGIAPLAADGSVDFGEIMRGVPLGPYRLVVRPLDPHSSFAPSGDPVFKIFTWNGDPISVAVGGIPEGLYSAQLFARDVPDRALGAPAWAAVIGAKRDAAIAGFRTARDIAGTWSDPEARQLFLRSYLVNAVFPQATPRPGDRHHHRER